jgi:hypothetical protein
MEKINYTPDINSVTSIPEIAEALGTAVSALDVWFPHVSKNIVLRWGKPEFAEYYGTLVQTTRPHRQGFPFEAMNEISIIADVHNELFPQYKSDLRIFM